MALEKTDLERDMASLGRSRAGADGLETSRSRGLRIWSLGTIPKATRSTMRTTSVEAREELRGSPDQVIVELADRGQGINRGVGAPRLLGPRKPLWGGSLISLQEARGKESCEN